MSFAKIRPRRGTATQWADANPVLVEGEMGIEVPDEGVGSGLVKFKFGDGVSAWNDLPYGVMNIGDYLSEDMLSEATDKIPTVKAVKEFVENTHKIYNVGGLRLIPTGVGYEHETVFNYDPNVFNFKDYDKIAILIKVGDYVKSLDFYKSVNNNELLLDASVYVDENHYFSGFVKVSFNNNSVSTCCIRKGTGWSVNDNFVITNILARG
jgi:hypothetical protein